MSTIAEPEKAAKRPPLLEVASLNQSDRLASFLDDTTVLYYRDGKGVFVNPDTIVRDESTNLAESIYDVMLDKDAHLAGVWDQRVNALLGLPRRVRAFDEDDAEQVKQAEFAQAVIERIPDLNDALRRVIFSVMAGFSVCEVIWALRDGAVAIEALRDRDRRRFVFDLDWKPRLRTADAYIEGIELDERKFLVSRWGARDGNPYGVGIGRALYWGWLFKKTGIKWWMVFLAKFGIPVVVGTHPQGASEAERTKLLRVIDSIQNNTGITIDDRMKVEMLAASTGSSDAYIRCSEYFDAQASKRIVGQTMSTENKGAGGIGVGGVASVHELVRTDILQSDAVELGQTLTTLVEWIVYWQFGPQKVYPYFEVDAAPPTDTKALAEADMIVLKELGLEVEETWLRERLGYPKPAPGAETIGGIPEPGEPGGAPLPKPGAPPAGKKPGEKPAKFAEDDWRERERDELEGVATHALTAAFLALQRDVYNSVEAPGKR